MTFQRGKELKALLREYNYSYYNLGESLVSDGEYDRLFSEYETLENLFPKLRDFESPIVTIGSPSTSDIRKITHTTPLLSIENKGKTPLELKKWYKEIGGDGTKVIIQPKFDGLTINTQYNEGYYVESARRGDGFKGDELSGAVLTIPSTLKTVDIEGTLEVRGEGVMRCEPFFEKYSNEYSNPRNLACGSFKLLDLEEVAKRELEIVIFDAGVCPIDFKDDEDRLIWLKEKGFNVTPYFVCDTFEELEKICFSKFNGGIIEKNGFNILDIDGPVTDILCDGLVIKVANLDLREKLGFTSRGPKFAFALKFRSITALSKLNDVSIQVGRTGKLTPVGHVEAYIGGTNISRVTLNNLDYIKNLGAAPEVDGIILKKNHPHNESEFYDYKIINGEHYLVDGEEKIKVENAKDIRKHVNKFFILVPGEIHEVTHVKTIFTKFEEYIVLTANERGYYLKPNMLLEAMAIDYPKVRVDDKYFELRIGDTVVIERANDVIPKCIGIRYDLRSGNESEILWPDTCPTCGFTVTHFDPLHYCTNVNCKDRLIGSIIHYVKRDAMNIDGFGQSMVELFIEKGFVKSLKDIYSINIYEDEILSIKGFGKTKLEKLYKAIEDSKNREFHQFLYSLGINEIGRTMSKMLCKRFKNIDTLMQVKLSDLTEIEDVGPVAAISLLSFFEKNKEIIEDFKIIGINMEEKSVAIGDVFAGKTFVITGTLKESRNYYQDLIEKNGGKVSGSVSKKTNYVVIGVDAGSKEDKAIELVNKGEPVKLIYGHDAFMELLEN